MRWRPRGGLRSGASRCTSTCAMRSPARRSRLLLLLVAVAPQHGSPASSNGAPGAGLLYALKRLSSPRYYSLATHPTQEHDVGEDHLFCWDAAALSLLAPPTELPVAEADAVRGAAFHRAPSRAVYRVLRPG